MTIEDTIKQAQADLSINDLLLDDALMTQAGNRLQYAIAAAKAQAAVDSAKINVDVVEASIDKSIRVEASESGKKITEKAIKSEIAQDSQYAGAQRGLFAAKYSAEVLKSVVISFDHRRDALVQLCKRQMVEQSGDMHINAEINKDAANRRRLQERGNSILKQDS